MSNAVSEVTSPPNSTTPWKRATLEFVSDPVFSSEEQKMLETGTLESLQRAIVAWDQEHAQRSTTRKLGDRLKPIISGLEVFGKALDVFSQVEPKGIFAAVWGSLRVLLVLGRGYMMAFEEIMDQMAKLGPSLQRLEIISTIHANRERLDKAVFRVFQKYLECVKAIRMIFKINKPGGLRQWLKEMISKAGKLITYQESFAESLREVEISCVDAEREAGLADTQAATAFYQEQRDRVGGVIDSLKGVDAKQDQLKEHLDIVEHRDKHFQEKQQQRWEEKDRRRLREQQKIIEEWLSPFNFQATQMDHFEKAYPTAGWLTAHPAFKHWTEGKRWQLRLYGEAGVGKTMLSSVLINHLQTQFDPYKRPVLCLFMNYNESKMHTPEHIFGSLLRQLVQLRGSQDPLPKGLLEYYQRAQSIGAKAKFREVREIICNTISTYERIYVVVDALDECSQKYRFSLLQDIQSLDHDRLSLMITERPDIPVDARGMICDVCQQRDQKEYYHCDICNDGRWDVCLDCKARGSTCKNEDHSLRQPYDVIGGRVQFDVKIPLSDLESYVRQELASEFGVGEAMAWDPRFPHVGPDTTRFARVSRRNPKLLEKMPRIIAGKADGRFLFAKLYWESVKAQLTVTDIQETLENLPEELGQLYQQILERVRVQNDSVSKKLAFRALSRVFFAQRPMSLAELQHLLATRQGDKDYDTRRNVDYEDILQSTIGLISIDVDEMAVTLSHQTLQDFLEKDAPREFGEAQAEMASECLTVLDYAFASSYAVAEDSSNQYPLAAYVSQHWGDHVQAVCDHEEIREKTTAVLSNGTLVQTVVRTAWQTDVNSFNSWDTWKGIHALHVSAWYGLDFAIYLLVQNGADVDVTEPTFQQTPLIYACRRGQFETARYLITIGANVNRFSARGSSPLFETIEQNQYVVFGDLLDSSNPENPVQVNSRHPRQSERTPLMLAIHHGHPHMIYKLLGHPGVDVNARDRNGQTALMIAGRKGLLDAAEFLLTIEGLDIDAADYRVKRTALISAAEFNHDAFVRLLMDRGADPNLGDRLGGTALMRATEQGRRSVVEVMLHFLRVDKQCRDLDGRGLLHAACANGNTDIIGILSQQGLEINLQDCNGMTPLHEAARCGQSKAAEILLSLKARPELEDVRGRTAYIVAWQYRHREIMNLLGARNASGSANPQSPENPKMKLPSWALVRHGRIDLLENIIKLGGAGLCETEPGTNNTVLHIAILCEQIDILQLLLGHLGQCSLSIDAVNRHLRTPLHLAVIKDDYHAVEMLLINKADFSKKDIWEATPLDIAVSDKRTHIALCLIESGALVDRSRHSDVQQLFFKAVERGSVKAAVALLQSGADKNGKTLDDGLTAYQIAKKNDVEMQRFLKVARTFTAEEMSQQLSSRRRETGMIYRV